MAVLVNSSYRQCIVPDCKELPIFAIIIEGTGVLGNRFRVATILTCSEHIDEGDERAKNDYPNFAREIFDNPTWLIREQQVKREQPDLTAQEMPKILQWENEVRALDRTLERRRGS